MTRRPAVYAAVVALLCVSARADAPDAPEVRSVEAAEVILPRFDHRKHERPLDRRGLGCPACHQVGGVAQLKPRDLDATYLAPPSQACHFCHNPPEGASPMGPRRCQTCHDEVPTPADHGAGWLQLHGTDARLQNIECSNCHTRSFCIDCHLRKTGVEYRSHDRTWVAVHGLAARADPTSCGSCHLQADCVDCHATGDGRW